MFKSFRWTNGRIAFGTALLVLGGSAVGVPANAKPLDVESSATASPVTAPSTMPPTLAATASAAPTAAVGATLNGPLQLAFDAAGNLYVSECWPYAAILRIDPSGKITTFAGKGSPGFAGDGGPAAEAQLYCPLGMAATSDGSLYVADHGNNRIRRIDATGIISTVVGSGPTGVDHGSFSGDGGLATAATLQEPVDVTFDGSGDLFISDRDNNRIRKVDPSGIISTIAGDGNGGQVSDGGLGTQTSLDFPLGVTTDAAGNVIFADAHHQRIRMIDRQGVISTVAGTGANLATGDGGLATAASLADPENVVFDAAGNLYITDTVNNILRRVDPAGIISTLASKLGGNDLTIDPSGNLFVVNGGENRVYRIDTQGTVTVYAGQ